MCATEHAPCGPCRVFECRHGLVEIVERGGGVLVERLRVSIPRPERDFMTFSKDASRRRHRSAQNILHFFIILQLAKGRRAVVLTSEDQMKIGNYQGRRRQRNERLRYDKYDTSRAKIVLAVVVGVAVVLLLLWLDYNTSRATRRRRSSTSPSSGPTRRTTRSRRSVGAGPS